MNSDNNAQRKRIQDSLNICSERVLKLSYRLFGDESKLDYETMSPFIPYAQYQAAIVQYQIWKRDGNRESLDMFNASKAIIGFFRRRWHVAGRSSLFLG